ncbi:class I SAM-dependent methyltransferase [Paenibacillus wynnii]|uniref:Methyltransferase type 11 domain-containing protein n=1 Tax=Paenibacillus wynnii TaxID=268407 RepID=A0A098MEJ7_9BACL|nr:class I SAM-dependent methyltransferase [Paenibacillus wynnii]KGE20486.1 hypothetical protein PWYN_14905 [Paenibacillus wynnii]
MRTFFKDDSKHSIRNGIIDFSESLHYYSDLDQEKMKNIIASSRIHGWRKTIFEEFSDNKFLLDIISDESRADWQYLLPLDHNSIALDIGAGWGTISIPLARNIKHVVALDGTIDRLEFLALRALQDKIENITVVHADVFQHPFKKEQFDIVSFNGVLEWVGVGDDADPMQKQLEALKIAYGLLKKGGYLYIGIENAQGLKYFLGEPDDHTNIKYISYLDREEANSLSQKHNMRPYKTYTYSKEGYHNLLKNAGFDEIEYYYPRPDYKKIEMLQNLGDSNVSDFVVESIRNTKPNDSINERVNDLEKVLNDYGNLEPFPASYSIVARKETDK